MSKTSHSTWMRVIAPLVFGVTCLAVGILGARTGTYWISVLGLLGAFCSCVVVLMRVKSGPIVGTKNW